MKRGDRVYRPARPNRLGTVEQVIEREGWPSYVWVTWDDGAYSDHECSRLVLAEPDWRPRVIKTGMTNHLERQITELQERNSKLEDERRMWKLRAEATNKLLHAMLGMMAARYGSDDYEARELIASVAARADRLERDAWTKPTALLREFITEATSPMGDYAPEIVTPVGKAGGYDTGAAIDDTPRAAFVRKWVARFQELLG